MEIYALDSDLNRIDLIEEYQSFIWTIRWREEGDFVLVIPESRFPYSTLKEGNYLEKDNSNRLMRIETVERKKGDDDQFIVEVSGRSLESYFHDRVVTPNNSAKDYWTLNGNVGWVATELVRRIAVAGTEFSSSDIIPNLRVAEQDASSAIEAKIPTSTLYEAVQNLCDEDGLGFRIFFDRPTKNFIFRVYRGVDRTVDQTVNQPVIFSDSLDTLSSTSMLRSSKTHKNVAYVRNGTTITAVSRGAMPSGTARRVLYVDAGDIEEPTPGKIRARGRLELAKHNKIRLFTGEVQDTRTYKYEDDYEIGDTVTTVDESGVKRSSKITEFITTYDSDGYRAYPTFSPVE